MKYGSFKYGNSVYEVVRTVTQAVSRMLRPRPNRAKVRSGPRWGWPSRPITRR